MTAEPLAIDFLRAILVVCLLPLAIAFGIVAYKLLKVYRTKFW
jgi:hypothetical protein